MSEYSNKNRDELGALWKQQSKDGKTKFLSGNLKLEIEGQEHTVKVVVFSNDKKGNDRAPDYRILRSKEMAQASTASNEDDIL